MYYEWLFFSLLTIIFLEKIKDRILYSKNMFLVMLMGLFTTLPHELAHYIVALILGGRPEGIYLIPKKIEKGGVIYYTFGSVKSYINGLTAFFIGFAPLLWLLAGFFLAKNWEIKSFIDLETFFILEWIFITNAIPSKTDLKIAFSSGWAYIILILIGVAIWLKFGKNFI